MKIELVYLHVVGRSSPSAPPPEYYRHYSNRFIDTYNRHPAGTDHLLNVVWCGVPETEPPRSDYNNNRVSFKEYRGQGWDLGAYQEIVRGLDCDIAVCLATPVHFWQDNWLSPLVNAVERYGDGYYGPMASYENMPHIRTSVFAVSPNTMREYPYLIDSREKCFRFESGFKSDGTIFECGEWGFSNWMASRSKPVLMVTRDRCYTKMEWRTPQNIFRRGNQSNCLVWDRHCDIYAAASPEERQRLEWVSDSLKCL